MNRFLKIFLSLILICGLANLGASAKTPEDECSAAKEAGLDCKVCGDCAVVIPRTGERICKKCNEYQCDMNPCDTCSEAECAKG